MKRFSLHQIKRDLSRSLLVSLLLSVSVFGWLRIIFFDFPFAFSDELVGLAKTIVIYWAMIFGIKMLLNLGLVLKNAFAGRSSGAPSASRLVSAAMILLICTIMVSCNIPPTGIKKNFNTGMVTKYSGMVPGETDMIMNGEVLNHTEIPLGESFTVINKGISGLVEQNGKVSVGCSLKISDTMGKQVFFEPDLFKESGIFNRDQAQSLRCEVNTGKPMEWDKTYAVSVVFWDKYGKGKIENSLNISTQDVP